MDVVIGVNDRKPSKRADQGKKWVRIKGGPLDGQWVQIWRQSK